MGKDWNAIQTPTTRWSCRWNGSLLDVEACGEMMRIPIREQLALLILLSALIGLAVISIATWISNHEFVLSICSSRLSLTASLKAAQLASNLDLMQTTATFLTTRVIIQYALQRYNWYGNNTESNWFYAKSDMAAAVGNGGT